MSASASIQMSMSEMIQSLTGYEEIAIRQNFGEDILNLLNTSPTTTGRALAFINAKRQGSKDAEAKKEVLGMSIKEVNDLFEDEADDLDSEMPFSDQGKDGTASE